MGSINLGLIFRRAEQKEKVFHVSRSPNHPLPALWALERVQLVLAGLTDVVPIAALEDLGGWSHLVEAHRTFRWTRLLASLFLKLNCLPFPLSC